MHHSALPSVIGELWQPEAQSILRSRSWKRSGTRECTYGQTDLRLCLAGLQTSLPAPDPLLLLFFYWVYLQLRNKNRTFMLVLLSLCPSASRLSVPSLKRTDAGLYQCMVRNRMGAVIHRRTEVQVACEYTPTHTQAHTLEKEHTTLQPLKITPVPELF